MKAMILAKIFEMLMQALEKHAPGLLKNFADAVLDWIEVYAMGDACPSISDKFLLQSCKMVRESFDIPDNDEETDIGSNNIKHYHPDEDQGNKQEER